MRVMDKNTNIIGEIVDIMDDTVTITYLDDFIPGWNNYFEYKKITLNKVDCVKLDDGLNSPWRMNINKFFKLLK
jgi:hypothetical protein